MVFSGRSPARPSLTYFLHTPGRSLACVRSRRVDFHALRRDLLVARRLMRQIDRNRLQSLMEREQRRFVAERPKSAALFERARRSLLGGVPMNWMAKWAGAFPPFVREARGSEV